jgi:6-phosphofructokinase 1
MKGKIGILTGGGDAPGLNAQTWGAKSVAKKNGYEVVGFLNGYKGIIENQIISLDSLNLEKEMFEAGTILGTSRTNPFNYEGKDASEILIQNLHDNKIDFLLPMGGNDTLRAFLKLHEKYKFPGVGVTKTIDGDISCYPIGFYTAIQSAMESINRLIPTAASHGRVFWLEMMGRDSGWQTVLAALATGSHIALIPEVKFDMDIVCEDVLNEYDRYASQDACGKGRIIVPVAESAKPKPLPEYEKFYVNAENSELDPFNNPRYKLREIAKKVAKHFEETMKEKYPNKKLEVRDLQLGHLLRGRKPVMYDVVKGIERGGAAVHLIDQGIFGVVPVDVAYDGTILHMPIKDAIEPRPLPIDKLRYYAEFGMNFGGPIEPYECKTKLVEKALFNPRNY